MQQLIVEHAIDIHAPAAKVWQVLTRPAFIRQWDDVPEDFGDDSLQMGSEFVWQGAGGQFTKLTVVAFEPHTYLRELWYTSNLELPANAYDIGYAFALSEEDGQTTLAISVGDWAKIPNGEEYYDASVEFAQVAAPKIKELAEA